MALEARVLRILEAGRKESVAQKELNRQFGRSNEMTQAPVSLVEELSLLSTGCALLVQTSENKLNPSVYGDPRQVLHSNNADIARILASRLREAAALAGYLSDPENCDSKLLEAAEKIAGGDVIGNAAVIDRITGEVHLPDSVMGISPDHRPTAGRAVRILLSESLQTGETIDTVLEKPLTDCILAPQISPQTQS